jgi:hypothetical protein
MHTPLPGVPHIESPFFERIFGDPAFDPETRRIARDLALNGYAVLDFPDPGIDAMAEAIKGALLAAPQLDDWRAGHSGTRPRIQDAWQFNAQVRDIACNGALLELLGKLYGRPAWPFQTLNFPRGTEQHYHTDALHFSSSPERFMCGVWLALEDIDDDNGPLVYYPGSHRWPIYTNEHIGRCAATMAHAPGQQLYEPLWEALVELHGIEPVRFTAKKGQALIWAANLMHGGAPQRDPDRTRWSQVTHYFFDDCAYFTPMGSDPFYGNIAFRSLINIATDQTMPQRYAGHAIPAPFVDACSANDWQAYADFDPALYLAANPDVAQANVNPAEHYLVHGRREKRKLRP